MENIEFCNLSLETENFAVYCGKLIISWFRTDLVCNVLIHTVDKLIYK